MLTCPLYWITAARPLSDAAGLAAALGVQALIVAAPSLNALAVAAAYAGFALGLRSQVAWLTLPILALAIARRRRGERAAGVLRVSAAYVAGALVWAIPLLIISGPMTYLRTFWNQGAEDLGGVAMLATTHTVSLLVHTLQDQLIAPWGYWQTGAVVIAFAMLGLVHLLWRDRFALTTLVACFGPYIVFDLLFQEAITTRYALPLIIPIAYLVIWGASLLHRHVAVVATIAIAAASVFVDDATAYGYAQMPAPAFRMLGDMHAAPFQSEGGHPDVPAGDPVLAMHRNQDFSMRRPIQWVGEAMPKLAAHLPAPPKHEWLEVVKYWNAGGRDPCGSSAIRCEATSPSFTANAARRSIDGPSASRCSSAAPGQTNWIGTCSTRPIGISAKAGRSRLKQLASPERTIAGPGTARFTAGFAGRRSQSR